MSRFLLCAIAGLFVVLSTWPALALDVVDAVITTAVVDREPVDAVDVFPQQSNRLYCFTRVVGAVEPTTLTHLWYRGEQLMSRVELPVESSNWRTWSTKRFLQGWSGDWRVEVRDEEGHILKQVEFQLR